MKGVFLLCCAFIIFVTTKAENPEVFGEIASGSYVIHSENVHWISSVPNHRVQRVVRYPKNAIEEDWATVIGGIVVTHMYPNTTARVEWGGPGSQYVGIKITSGPGENIDSWIEIFSE